jgi:hypothetical protein
VTDPISRLNPALELLRQRLSEHAQRLDSPGKGGAARTAPGQQPDRAARLRQRVAERLKALDAAARAHRAHRAGDRRQARPGAPVPRRVVGLLRLSDRSQAPQPAALRAL